MIRIVAVGRLKDRRLADLAGEYRRRIRPLAALEVVELKDQTPERESRRFLDRLGPAGNEVIIALDERGASIDSQGLARLLGRHGSLAFLIGGADGLADPVRERANRQLRLSRLTLTHEWARVLLLEQIYRGLSILRGMPYHRG
ncbi:MAG TPA: 23S rRNA (pseudouridine(1915)-N(3))-methyltransferase RlmH [Candidatus Krumholzibacteria bacterium]|nr:23S rRNA (pseudouridine(1915)-N(3))-methyltransferase RlmH [Candidatus Krumholzibacteria bacterium]HPD70592.1 23S rRNA (pseudouridine(1915)-N(3))-methyltransferase RlmH [Candidatus Krumholzibacteria bacterium]HRY39708.1 23S rRNA (pseudouridine(1915)-N(3))-methyltransferase RlmH [Candidatus Krumholzibacteria bacterium]